MSYQRAIKYVPGQTLRGCDICGLQFRFPAEFLPRSSDGRYRCKRFCAPKGSSTNEILTDRDRAIAMSRSRLRESPPPPGAREYVPGDGFSEEGTFLDFICQTAPDQARVAHGAILPLPRIPSDAGQAIIYLDGFTKDVTRWPSLRARAASKMLELADFLLSVQRGFGDTPSATLETDPAYGSFVNVARMTVDTADGGLGLLRAWQASGKDKYLTGARAAAHHLRTMQSAAFATTLFTSSDPNGAVPLYLGAFCLSMTAAGRYDHRYSVNGWWPLWFLSEMQKAVGDAVLGAVGTVGGFFVESVAAPISKVLADARSFWATGIPDFGTTASIIGLSAGTPRQEFAAFPTGTGTWVYEDGINGAQVVSLDFARSMWAMAMVDGVSDQAKALWLFLRGFAADFPTPPDTSPELIAVSSTGTYDATLAPTTLLNVKTLKIGSSLYDLRAAGMIAPLSSALDLANFTRLKKALGRVRNRAGKSEPLTTPEVEPAFYYTASAPVGNVYRYAPKLTRTYDVQTVA